MKQTNRRYFERLEDRQLLTGVSLNLQASLLPQGNNPQTDTRDGSKVAASPDYYVTSAYLAGTNGVGKSGVVNVYDRATNSLLFTIDNPNPDPDEQFRFGQAVAIEGDLLVVGAPDNGKARMEKGEVYVFDLSAENPTTPVFELINPGSSGFGYDVDISGTRIVVGAPKDEGNANLKQSGSAHVFDIATSTQHAYSFRDPSPLAFNLFGGAVAIEGDTVLVSASGNNTDGVEKAGIVHRYNLAGSTPWLSVDSFSDATPEVNERFGQAIDIFGNRVVAGVPDSNFDGLTNSGAALIYDLDDLESGPIANLTNPFPGANERFGTSVAIDGDTVAVSGLLGPSSVGIAHVYDLASETPETATLRINNPTPDQDDSFLKLAMSDGVLLVGAPNDDTLAVDAGSSYVYDLQSANPIRPTATLNTPLPTKNEQFGNAYDISGDLVAVATRADIGGKNDGRIMIFDATKPATDPILTIESPYTTEPFAHFANSVAFAGNNLLAVGTRRDEVLLYDLSSATANMPLTAITIPGDDFSNFGADIVADGNLVGVRMRDSVHARNVWRLYDVSSPEAPVALPHEFSNRFDKATISGSKLAIAKSWFDIPGKVSIYDLDSDTPEVPAYEIDAPAGSELFGNAFALDGNTLVVGAPETNDYTGVAYIYDLTSATPTQPVHTIDNPTGLTFSNFGDNVAVDGNLLAVAATRSHMQDFGTVYLFDLGSENPSVTAKVLPNRSPNDFDRFGTVLGVAGDRLIAGSPFDDTENFSQGNVEVWEVSGFTPVDPPIEERTPPNVSDIDLLCGRIGTDADEEFDWNEDGSIDHDDVSYLVETVMNTFFGDRNLDGEVAFDDFLKMSANFGTTNASWSQGDFDCDGVIGFSDFLILSENFGFKRD